MFCALSPLYSFPAAVCKVMQIYRQVDQNLRKYSPLRYMVCTSVKKLKTESSDPCRSAVAGLHHEGGHKVSLQIRA